MFSQLLCQKLPTCSHGCIFSHSVGLTTVRSYGSSPTILHPTAHQAPASSGRRQPNPPPAHPHHHQAGPGFIALRRRLLNPPRPAAAAHFRTLVVFGDRWAGQPCGSSGASSGQPRHRSAAGAPCPLSLPFPRPVPVAPALPLSP